MSVLRLKKEKTAYLAGTFGGAYANLYVTVDTVQEQPHKERCGSTGSSTFRIANGSLPRLGFC